jgi:hypothetical protein
MRCCLNVAQESRVRLRFRLVAAAGIALMCTGCAFSFADYEPVSTRFASPHRIRLEISNRSAALRQDPMGGGVRPHPYGSKPPLDRYVYDSLSKEFLAAGFGVVDEGVYDATVNVKIEDVVIAEAMPLYLPLIVLWMKTVVIVHLNVTVEMGLSGRSFRRRFASVEDSNAVVVIIIPINFKKKEAVVKKASQQCFSEVVKGVAQLLESHR